MTTLTAPPLVTDQPKAQRKVSPDLLVRLACAALNCNMEDVFASSDLGNLNMMHANIRRHVILAAKRMANAVGSPLNDADCARACGMNRTSIVYTRCSPDTETPAMMNVADILAATCAELGVKEHDIGSKARHRNLIWGRRIVTIIARQSSIASYPMIAESMGLPAHSTVMTAHKEAGRCLSRERGHPSRTVLGRDAQDIIDRVKGRLGITSDPT